MDKITPEVERVARAIHSEVWRRRGEPAPAFERDAEHYYTALALAAMEALLEPSEEMVRAATDYIATNIDGGCSAHDAREVLRAALTRAMGR
jgi:translation initiation factor 2 alpha subunit (eIF-2alpha)